MSVVLALVGEEHLAVATDSLLVVLQGDGFVSRTNYAKTFTEGSRIGAIAGVVMPEGDDLGPSLAECLRQAPGPREILPIFVRENDSWLRKGAEAWRRVAADDSIASFTAFVAGFAPSRRRLEAYHLIVQPSGRFVIEAVPPGGDLANGVLYGTYDAELDRWSTRYRYEHLTAAFGGGRPGPAPYEIGVDASESDLRQAAAQAIATAIERDSGFPHPDWWPPSIPVIAGPVQVATL